MLHLINLTCYPNTSRFIHLYFVQHHPLSWLAPLHLNPPKTAARAGHRESHSVFVIFHFSLFFSLFKTYRIDEFVFFRVMLFYPFDTLLLNPLTLFLTPHIHCCLFIFLFLLAAPTHYNTTTFGNPPCTGLSFSNNSYLTGLTRTSNDGFLMAFRLYFCLYMILKKFRQYPLKIVRVGLVKSRASVLNFHIASNHRCNCTMQNTFAHHTCRWRCSSTGV